MSDDSYPDREAWPRYWRAIRIGAVWLVVGAVIVGGGAFLPRPEEPASRIVLEVLIGLCAVGVASVVADRVNEWWEERHP